MAEISPEQIRKAFFESHPDPMMIFDRESLAILDVNEAAIAHYGYSRKEFLAMTIGDLRPSEDLPAMKETIAALQPGPNDVGNWQHRKKSGEVFSVNITNHLIDFQGSQAVHATVRDMSHMAGLDNALQEQETNWRIAQRLLGIGSWKLDLQTGHLSRTENIYEMYRIPEEEFGHSFEDYLQLVHPDDRENFAAEFAAFDIRPGAVFDFTHRIVRGDNSIIHIRGIGEVTETHKGPIITGVVQNITPQIEAEARLAAADDLLRIANQAARLGAWQVDLTKNQVTWTEETAAIHELPGARTMPVEEALAYYAPESVGRIREVFGRCVEDGTPFDEVLQLVTAKGRRISVRSIGKAVHDETGRIVTVRGAFQDVSELVTARQNLETLTRRLLDTFESMSDAFYLLDRDFRFTYMNPEAERLLGRKSAELFGRYIWDEFPLIRTTIVREHMETAMNSGRSVAFFHRNHDSSLWFHIKVHPGADGLAVYFQDVTRERESQEKLRLSEERFQLIARATDDVVWDWDLLENTIWWNDRLRTVMGFDEREVPTSAQWWESRVLVEDRVRVLDSIQALFDGRHNSWREEYRFMHADGHAVTVIDRGFVIRDENGKAVRMIGTMLDISERMEMEERLRQSQKLETIGQLTGGVAHDFNNLLTVILGNAELINEQLSDHPGLRPLAEMTVKAAERGAELTNRLLAFARRQALDPKVIDINELVTGMDGLLRRTLTGNIEIEVEQNKDLWLAEIDPGQLEVAILNLAINARDAMSDGGRLTIETANAELDEIYARLNDEVTPGFYVLVSVSDSGSGMPEEIVERAFDPFFTTKDVGKGSGLGLSMVYGFVKQSGGHAKIYSEPGEGTTIRLYLPKAGEDSEVESIPRELPEVVGGNEGILVVEDDALVRENLVAQLEELGYRVISTDGGIRALEVLEQQGGMIDLLFTDVVMPGGINGRQLAERARGLHPQLKILFTSGYTENAIVHQGRLDPGVNLLSKPYRRQEMAAKVRAVLDESSASGSGQ